MSGDLTARDVIARTRLELDDWTGPLPEWALAYADEVLAALVAAGWRLERDEQWEWEWGVTWDAASEGAVTPWPDEQSARDRAAGFSDEFVVRRTTREAGEWEVAP